jgi:lysyl-tRNA synthetase class 1
LDSSKQPDSAVWHLFNKGTNIPSYRTSLTFSLINNLISAVGTDDIDLIMEYLKRYDASIDKFAAIIEDLVKCAMSYYRDIVLPNKKYRTPTEEEREILKSLYDTLVAYDGDDENGLQTIPFNVARKFEVSPKNLFKTFYEVVLGQDRGPRFGTFIRLVGKDKVLDLLETASRG